MPRSKFSPELQERVCQLIRVGNTHQVAAEAVGIGESTLREWKATKPGFREAVERAQAEAESILVAQVAQAARAGSWRAAAWLLQHRSPENWGDGAIPAEVTHEDEPKRSRLDELGARRAARRSGDSTAERPVDSTGD